ncbi:hypothetical protein [Mesorhizobium sp. L2C084A000]|uniref:hypothetical protein n=1 Tax=Mesorhizobium sp. L2C084A000 TaxID=1287116 RepID=UPI0018C951F9|nr:hypothetical protein [Mesorhizobium sp. L2C084A000]
MQAQASQEHEMPQSPGNPVEVALHSGRDLSGCNIQVRSTIINGRKAIQKLQRRVTAATRSTIHRIWEELSKKMGVSEWLGLLLFARC